MIKSEYESLLLIPKPDIECEICGKPYNYSFNHQFAESSKKGIEVLGILQSSILPRLVWLKSWQGHERCLAEIDARYAKEKQIEQQILHQKYVHEIFRSSNLKQANVASMSLSNAIVDQDNKVAWSALSNWKTGKSGIALVGGTGTGKTFLLKSFAADKLREGTPVKFYQMSELLDDLRKGFGEKGSGSYYRLFESIKTVPILVLDDLGVENPTEFSVEKITQLLDFRLTENMPTFFSSNLSGNDFAKRFPPRLMSRLNYACDFISCDGPDRRIKEVQKRRLKK